MKKAVFLLIIFLSACVPLTPTISTETVIEPSPTVQVDIRPAVRSIDLVAYQSSRYGVWFSTDLDAFPEVQQEITASFAIENSPIENQREGKISSTLPSGYFFLQWDISSEVFERYADTIGALFIRVAGSLFVDYLNNRAFFDWTNTSEEIPADIQGIIKICNTKNIPVFLEANYSDYVPGDPGTGIESFQRADNIAGTINFLKELNTNGLHIDGLTYGNEYGDPGRFQGRKPTIYNSDYVGRFLNFARGLKAEYPELKIYAFDSNIGAARGRMYEYWPLLKRVHQAEIEDIQTLLDGFIFRESYVYIDKNGRLLDSQLILDDTESLYRDTPVYRYDTEGETFRHPDRDYLHTVIDETTEIFGRSLDIGLTEYLPAGPVNISETGTSLYSDAAFIVHYSDIVGMYAELGLDFVSTIMFGDSVDMHKAYFDRDGNQGANYPIHEQLKTNFSGQILKVVRSVDYDILKVKVYASHINEKYFVMILNKDVNEEAIIQITIPDQLDLKVRIPPCSYTSLILDNENIIISGIGE
jgi:hypothetical protein